MEKIKILGYSYDEKSNKFFVNEDESKLVKILFKIETDYHLNSDEVSDLLFRNYTINQIIESRINDIWYKLYEEGKVDSEDFEYVDIVKTLEENKNVQENIIDVLLSKKLDFIDMNVSLENDIIFLIDKRCELQDLVETFNDIKDEIQKNYGKEL